MAEKHKSKYKKPENKKPTYRKDLKDYTMDDKEGKLNPKTTGNKQHNVLRKTDKNVQDDGKMYPKYDADDRLYKDLEDGEYDPKTAATRMKKRQDAEEKTMKSKTSEKISALTREQKERLIREYIRRKFVSRLIEREAAETEPAPEPETPDADATPDAATDPTATDTATDAAATDPTATDAAAAPPPPPATDTAAAPTDMPAADMEMDNASPEDKAKEELAKQQLTLKNWKEILDSERDPAKLVELGFSPLVDPLTKLSKKSLNLAKRMMIRQIAKLQPITPNPEHGDEIENNQA